VIPHNAKETPVHTATGLQRQLRSWGNDSKPPHQAIAALGAPGAAISCSGMQPEESRNEDYDNHDADEVKNIHCSFRFEASAASV
jgi:hypothetical protein